MSGRIEADPGGSPGGAGPVWGPHNTVTVVDPSPVNWLSITWNTMEEANRVDHEGMGQPSLASGWRWVDDETLELTIGIWRQENDGDPFERLGSLLVDNLEEVEAELGGFSRYALAY